MSRVWGIGAYWSDAKPADLTRTFIDGGYAQIGWSSVDAPALYELFARIDKDDYIYIKSKPPGKPLRIKAIGVVKDKPDGSKVKVQWIVKEAFDQPLTPVENRYNVYRLTLYEEMNPSIRWIIKEKMEKEMQPR